MGFGYLQSDKGGAGLPLSPTAAGPPLPYQVQAGSPSRTTPRDFPGGPAVKNLLPSAGDAGSIPTWGTDPTCHRATKLVHLS